MPKLKNTLDKRDIKRYNIKADSREVKNKEKRRALKTSGDVKKIGKAPKKILKKI